MRKKNLIAMAIVTALSTGLVVGGVAPVLADNAQNSEAVAKSTEKTADKSAEQDFIKVSEDALLTMRNVRGARLAIFNGSPDKAQTYADAAVARVAVAIKDAEKYAVETKQPMKGGDQYVPFDASLGVAESFVPTEEKMKHIAQANKHLHKGESKQAIEVLKLGEVDVAVATRLMPVKFAQEKIAEADKLISDGKYYQANLVLKAVEDAVVMETFAIDTMPTTPKPKP